MKTLVLNNIEVLRLSPFPDSTGAILSPSAVVKFLKKLPITYGDGDQEFKAGVAHLTRLDDIIFADMVLNIKEDHLPKAREMIAKLYPAVEYAVHEMKGNSRIKIKITNIVLSPYPNDDLAILQIGNRAFSTPSREDMN